MGHHFSSIALRWPHQRPHPGRCVRLAPVLLWVLIGGIFFGGVHDFGRLFASVRHKGQSIGEVIISTNIGPRAKKLFNVFAYLTLVLVVAAFASIVANTFCIVNPLTPSPQKCRRSDQLPCARGHDLHPVHRPGRHLRALVYRRNAPLGVASVIGIIAIVICLAIGLNFHPLMLTYTTWMLICGVYIAIASVTPVWILPSPVTILSSFLLYGMMIIAVLGVLGPPLSSAPSTATWTSPHSPPATAKSMAPSSRPVRHHCLRRYLWFPLPWFSGTTAKQLTTKRTQSPSLTALMLLIESAPLSSPVRSGLHLEPVPAGEITTPPPSSPPASLRWWAPSPASLPKEGVVTTVSSLLVLAVPPSA